MPSQQIWLTIEQNVQSPTITKLFNSIKQKRKISFSAYFEESEKRRWRANNTSSYQLTIFAVERLPETTNKGNEYIFKCQLIGMNGVRKYPYGFSYPQSKRENYCEIYINTLGESRFGYHEYLTL